MPLSHDEVVHGKRTIVDKMSGTYEEKFAQARLLYLYMMTHPGKKLNFMGNEIGQIREWDERREPDWFLLKYPMHDAFHCYIMELNQIYLKNPALWENDYDLDGFEWVNCHLEEKGMYVYLRRSKEQTMFIILNMSGRKQSYCHNLEPEQILTLLIDSSWECFNGTSKVERNKIEISDVIDVEPLSGKCYLVTKK